MRSNFSLRRHRESTSHILGHMTKFANDNRKAPTPTLNNRVAYETINKQWESLAVISQSANWLVQRPLDTVICECVVCTHNTSIWRLKIHEESEYEGNRQGSQMSLTLFSHCTTRVPPEALKYTRNQISVIVTIMIIGSCFALQLNNYSVWLPRN